ncbi:MAG: hypothetical protein DWH99_02405, partial [Planctomycetota bacterium]
MCSIYGIPYSPVGRIRHVPGTNFGTTGRWQSPADGGTIPDSEKTIVAERLQQQSFLFILINFIG